MALQTNIDWIYFSKLFKAENYLPGPLENNGTQV